MGPNKHLFNFIISEPSMTNGLVQDCSIPTTNALEILQFCIKPSKYSSQPLSISQVDGLVQERRNSIADAMELRLSCTYPADDPDLWYMYATLGQEGLTICVLNYFNVTIKYICIYISFPNIGMMQVVEVCPHGTEKPVHHP